ncbi:uncharacterized membrane protein (UPF0127 family) [Lysobacter niastensis]|uniref:Uncharacterized membrane protein (UPF0127 family) n=2 Tax=Lysobacter niastensis TaxID=380629 RepID=A0ABU1W7K1_9GAMM|nr:uncharacterized membrane protein (UPF0127 family) [Lysobacter niastensis]
MFAISPLVRLLMELIMSAMRVLLVFCGLALAGCASGTGLWVELGGQRYAIEIADDDAERARGLMFRDELAVDHGMLFIHERQEPLAYWMKNTKIPLDILYFDDALKLVSQQRDVPPCSLGDRCPPYPSNAPARYVLELNAGEAARIGLKDGAELKFGPGIEAGN